MPTLDPLIGRRLGGKYEITGLIGRGGFGAVYRAIQAPVNRIVAVKVIASKQVDDSGLNLKERFFREAEMVSGLRSSSVVSLHDYGVEDDGLLYMVLEYIDGEELAALVTREAPLSPDRIGVLGTQILEALVEAHALGVIHRDLKPANVMIVRDALDRERARVLDFGIAKVLRDDLQQADDLATGTNIVLGTPAYMAPEQAYGRNIGPWSDQYSIGVILYLMATGKLPHQAPSAFELLLQKNRDRPPAFNPALGIPDALGTVIFRALAVDPNDRYPSTAAMAQALIAAHRSIIGTGERPVQAVPVRPSQPPKSRQTAALPDVVPPASRPERGSGPTAILPDAEGSMPPMAVPVPSKPPAEAVPEAIPVPEADIETTVHGLDGISSNVAGALPSGVSSLLKPPPPYPQRGRWLAMGGVALLVGLGLMMGFGGDDDPRTETTVQAAAERSGGNSPPVPPTTDPPPPATDSNQKAENADPETTPIEHAKVPATDSNQNATNADGAGSPFDQARAAALKGDGDEAFGHLSKAKAAKTPNLWASIAKDPAFASLMKDDRMAAYHPKGANEKAAPPAKKAPAAKVTTKSDPKARTRSARTRQTKKPPKRSRRSVTKKRRVPKKDVEMEWAD